MTIDEVNALPEDVFLARFGFLYEHSPWVVAAAAKQRPFADGAAMRAAMSDVVEKAGVEAQLALLRAHPDLAGKAARDDTLTDASKSEQASAGLDRLTPEEYDLFQDRNTAYQRRFGFPFIICVRNHTKASILEEMKRRGDASPEGERATALNEVSEIVRHRLSEVMPDASR